MIFRTIMQVVSGLLTLYMLLIFLRVILSWFRGNFYTKPYQLLIRITEPYLGYFRRFKALKTERFDFSPIVALMVLVVLLNISDTLAHYGRITFGLVLSFIVQALWSGVAFFLIFFFILILVRFIALSVGRSSVSPVWLSIDMIIEPVLVRIAALFSRGKPMSYRNGLILSGAVLLIIRILGGLLIKLITNILRSIPF